MYDYLQLLLLLLFEYIIRNNQSEFILQSRVNPSTISNYYEAEWSVN